MMTSVLTNLITGFLGVGKTTAIRSILGRKPPHEKWTLVNRSDDEMGKATIAYRRDSRVEIIAKKEKMPDWDVMGASLLACLQLRGMKKT